MIGSILQVPAPTAGCLKPGTFHLPYVRLALGELVPWETSCCKSNSWTPIPAVPESTQMTELSILSLPAKCPPTRSWPLPCFLLSCSFAPTECPFAFMTSTCPFPLVCFPSDLILLLRGPNWSSHSSSSFCSLLSVVKFLPSHLWNCRIFLLHSHFLSDLSPFALCFLLTYDQVQFKHTQGPWLCLSLPSCSLALDLISPPPLSGLMHTFPEHALHWQAPFAALLLLLFSHPGESLEWQVLVYIHACSIHICRMSAWVRCLPLLSALIQTLWTKRAIQISRKSLGLPTNKLEIGVTH